MRGALGLLIAFAALGCSGDAQADPDRGPVWVAGNPMPPTPEWARGILGELRLAVSETGEVEDSLAGQVWAYSPGDIKDPEFQAALLSTVRSWRFEPARVDGEAVPASVVLDLVSNGSEDFTRTRLAWEYRDGAERDTLAAIWTQPDSPALPTAEEALSARRTVLATLAGQGVISRRDPYCVLVLNEAGFALEAESQAVRRVAESLGLTSPQSEGCLDRPLRILVVGRPFVLGPGRIRMRVAVEPTPTLEQRVAARRVDCEVHTGSPGETRCEEVRGVPSTDRFRIAQYLRAYPGAW